MVYDLNDDVFYCKELLKKEIEGEYRYLYKGRAYTMSDPEAVREIQSRLVEERDYVRAKNFNEYLMMVTRIGRFSLWLHYPVNIQVEHTNRCNARCVMCGHFNADRSWCMDLKPDIFRQLSGFLPFARYAGLHGYGEPFLAKDLLDCLQIYKKFGVRLYVNSNLNYLPETFIPYIRDCFDEINVSCDGATEEVYEEIRRGLSFRKLTENLRILKESCPSLRLRLFVVVMRQNLQELPAFIDLARKYGFKEVVFTEMIPLEENHNRADSVKNYPALYHEMLIQAVRKSKEYGIPLRFSVSVPEGQKANDIKEERKKLNHMMHIRRKEIEKDSRLRMRENNLLFSRKRLDIDMLASRYTCKGICDNFFSQFYVTLDGRIAVCCVDGLHYVAKLSEIRSMEEYWNLASVKKIRETFEEGRLPFFCENCNFLLLGSLRHLCLDDIPEYARRVGGSEVRCVGEKK